jgi:hypothetical protein
MMQVLKPVETAPPPGLLGTAKGELWCPPTSTNLSRMMCSRERLGGAD